MGNCGKLQAVFFLASFPSLSVVREPFFLGMGSNSSLGILFIYVVALLQEVGGVMHKGKSK